MRHPKDVGDESTLAIMYILRRFGYGLYLPFGENTRCDLIIEQGSTLRRVQCKTGRLRNGAVKFATCSSYAHHPNPKILNRSYHGEIDDFAVFCPELDAVYLIPIEDLPNERAALLRVTPSRNGQQKNVRLAAAYEIARIDVY